MKSKLTKLWGIGLVIVLLTSLFVAAAPASAQPDPLRWQEEPLPGAKDNLGVPGTDIYDMAINGDIIYAVCQDAVLGLPPPGVPTAQIYKSINGGVSWTNLSARLAGAVVNVMWVAVAPDDADVVAIGGTTGGGVPAVEVSDNGGTTWATLGVLQDAAAVAATNIYDVDISARTGAGIRYVACPGNSGAGPALYYFNLGAAAPVWRNAVVDFLAAGGANLAGTAATWSFRGFAFSPNFQADFMAVAISANIGVVGGLVQLHVLSFNSFTWNAVSPNYPVTVQTSVIALAVQKIALALSPDYVGSDEILRVVFVAMACNSGLAGAEIGGIWRCEDDTAPKNLLANTAINSVAFNGTELVAGEFYNNNVRRCSDPLVSSPTVLNTRSLKRIGVDSLAPNAIVNDQVVVAFHNSSVVGVKQGAASAFSVSTDGGMTWNGISLMDSAMTAITDVYNTGTHVYVATNDWNGATGEASIYRLGMPGDVKKVLCVDVIGQVPAGAPTLMLRGAADNPEAIYAVDNGGGTQMYYTSEGGLTRWYSRTAPAGGIIDLAAESEDICYVAIGNTLVRGLSGGFTWDQPITLSLLLGAVNTLYSVGEDQLLVGGTLGNCVFTTDGGDTWADTVPIGGAMFLSVTASGLSAGDYIYAADGLSHNVWRAAIGGPIVEFKNMNVPGPVNVAPAVGEMNLGIVLVSGVLYTTASSPAPTLPGTLTVLNHTLVPTKGTLGATDWSTVVLSGSTMAAIPNALKASVTPMGSIKLYAVDTVGNPTLPPPQPKPGVWYFEDTVAMTGPTLIGPAEGALFEIVSELLGAPYNVNFTWQRQSLSTAYIIDIALDENFVERVVNRLAVGPTAADTVSAIIAGGTFLPGTTYYWRVQATVPIFGAFSETRTFTIQPGTATVPKIGSPENGATITTGKPAFSWGPVAKTTMYEFELSADPSFATTLVSQQTAATGLKIDVELEPGTYFWRVRALEPVKGDWSMVANFVVAEAAPPGSDQPVINIPDIVIPDIEVPTPEVVVQPAPAEPAIPTGLLWAIIIIGAVLVIALIILIVRTRRAV